MDTRMNPDVCGQGLSETLYKPETTFISSRNICRSFFRETANSPFTVTSHGYQITSTSAKLTALKRHFYDLSENVCTCP